MILSGIGSGMGLLWWIRRLYKQIKNAKDHEQKLNKMDAKLDAIQTNQRHTDKIMSVMALCIDDIRVAEGKPRKFTQQELTPTPTPDVQKHDYERAKLMQEIQDSLAITKRILNPGDACVLPSVVEDPTEPPVTPKEKIKAKLKQQA